MGAPAAADPPFSEAASPLTRNIGRPRTILDIGAGLGRAASIVRERGGRIVGVELRGDAARREDYDEVLTTEIDRLPSMLQGRTFDLLFLNDLLEHVSEPLATLKHLRTLLNDGGHLLLSMPAQAGAFRSDDAIRVVEGAGFEVMRVAGEAPSRPLVRYATAAGALLAPHLVTRHLVVSRQAIIARVPPKQGGLTVTVGMLSLNEKESMQRMIAEIRTVAPDAKLLVVDSSSDETPEIARAHGARVVRQLPPRGHGPAMQRLMYEAALESDALIYLDCDFTYPASAIPRIRELLEAGADVVNTSRTYRYQEAMPVPNFLANRLFAAAAQVAHGVPTTDVHSGMRGYRTSVIRAFDFSGAGDALPLDTLIMPARSHYRVVELPIPYFERKGASKLARLRGTVWTFVRIVSSLGEGSRVRVGVRYRHVDE